MAVRCCGIFIAISILVLCCDITKVRGSAIPMWEFLSRDEKMSHLYRVFSRQVARYCADSSMPDCNKNLLVSGLRNLATMDENLLDKMDPYQRGAQEIIWRGMMRNNGFANRIGTDLEDSYYANDADPLANSGSEHNGLAEESAPVSDYVRPTGHTGPYLMGPMVIRVFPDGRPVPGDSNRPLPRDEDVDDLKFSKLPSIEEIEASSGSLFYGKSNVPKKPLFSGSGQQRPSVIPTTRGSHRRNNPLFDNRRIAEISNNARSIRFY
ncbi:rhythmically expressed gene 5 protein [Cephus cinctus]|uniref:Rhythmically expressed gene 5 protein n=1 Tax=Cephus cinctus TaxID=211228 RepID=A0AAJ7FSY0_CEPCN|nr:rhythmically expressed gene 5 protein [Cephus cinctus]XP_015606735.1 rhythmically expressed gene 5 protein [Cephus cinctus]XP_024946334.1 rhythmically expressed gene 5 protein [Cephus cinctus]XP_024946335.1 rhythmically expressed gene 5 protein [Cephus cinctus]